MDYGRILFLQEVAKDEALDTMEILEIGEAFDELVKSGVELRDLPENAMVEDQLDELESNASVLEKELYKYVAEHFGESEAQDPSWSTKALADHLNQLQIIKGADNGTIGALLQ